MCSFLFCSLFQFVLDEHKKRNLKTIEQNSKWFILNVITIFFVLWISVEFWGRSEWIKDEINTISVVLPIRPSYCLLLFLSSVIFLYSLQNIDWSMVHPNRAYSFSLGRWINIEPMLTRMWSYDSLDKFFILIVDLLFFNRSIRFSWMPVPEKYRRKPKIK